MIPNDPLHSMLTFHSLALQFLAYYGVLTHDRTTALEAWNQIAYYRHYLRDSSGLWHHILYGSFNDTTFWGTGMAWSVAGMARVYATYKHAPAAANIGDFSVQMGKIRQFLNELLAAMLKQIRVRGENYTYGTRLICQNVLTD